jgi:small subunit ribosomal protein S13
MHEIKILDIRRDRDGSFVRETTIVDSSGEDQEKRMSYISGARLLPDEQVRIASTKMDGIGPKKAIQLRYRLGISGNIKMNELTKYQIDQIEQMVAQDHVVHWELKRGERADIERLISISHYR